MWDVDSQSRVLIAVPNIHPNTFPSFHLTISKSCLVLRSDAGLYLQSLFSGPAQYKQGLLECSEGVEMRKGFKDYS